MAFLLPSKRIRAALAWRVRRVFGDQSVDRLCVTCAKNWRPLLKKPVFIGICGSAGKTTTKELLLGVLSHTRRGTANPASLNAPPEIAKTILRVRRNHDFCVTELSEDKPGVLDVPLALLEPDIGIVTIVGDDHSSKDYPREAIATEISKLIAALPATGTAVLNADDPLVLAMADHSVARVITYGVSPQAELRAENITSVWPERLQMTLIRGTERVRLHTRLCGTHWLPAVLSAVGGGLAAGLTLTECAEGLATVEPFDGRMQPVTTTDGVSFIRDDFKAPLWTVDACFKFMQEAQAKRKIIVIGELSDTGSRKESGYVRTAGSAQEIADITIFVGPWASSVFKARKTSGLHKLLAFNHVLDAANYLNSIVGEGDLVLLKGNTKNDHLLRIILARSEKIACWRDDCARDSFCNECPHRNKPSGSPACAVDASPGVPEPREIPLWLRPIESGEQVIVGLGNSDAKYAGTPHNVGYEFVDHLLVSAALNWDETPEARIARGAFQGHQVCLVKIRMPMNLIGGGLKRLAEQMDFSPEQCILIYDDLDLPVGTVRSRLKGSAGGHRGVASILEAFQTDAIRRIKIGVGQTGVKLDVVNYVLSPFDVASRKSVDLAISLAKTHVLDIVERPNTVKGSSRKT
ncbi:aminoacyl-tRNA hydrolase [Propionivibrio sp.]|uniref:aminoacyl-tRNA hydrolase n=1 Tax=Propionivibrio sp. TaxID=2212460 RepID=UPI0025E49A02|nr:aminoacyl-tRNA hydrolase [Propionivibrio sp.]MBK8744499.1 hypothetical protein [Propionivibrio sp.]